MHYTLDCQYCENLTKGEGIILEVSASSKTIHLPAIKISTEGEKC